VEGPYGRKMDGYELGKPRGSTGDGKQCSVFVYIGGRTGKRLSVDEHAVCRINKTLHKKSKIIYFLLFFGGDSWYFSCKCSMHVRPEFPKYINLYFFLPVLISSTSTLTKQSAYLLGRKILKQMAPTECMVSIIVNPYLLVTSRAPTG